MKKTTKHLSVYLLLLMLACSLAFAGGYQINEHGARAMGMGGAFVARASDGSAMYFNAAGLGFQKGINVLVGTTLIFPSTTFTGPSPLTTETEMVSQVFYPSNLYASYAVNEKWVVGLGVYNPFGLGTEWPADWPTTTNKSGSRRTVKTDLQTFYINPTVAFKVNDKLSVGAGVSYVLANAKISYRVGTFSSLAPPTPATKDGTVGLEGDGSGISFNVGVIYKPMEKLSLGASYRSLVDIEFSGPATFTDMQALQSFFPGGDGTVTLPMPSNLQIGAAYDVSPKLTVEADFQYVDWASYDELAITIPTGPAAPAALGGQPLQKSGKPTVKKWHEGWLMRLGGEYKLNDKLDLRAGFIYDYSPQPTWNVEPMLPDANKTDVSIGASYKVNEKISIDASYMLVLAADRTSTLTGFTGTYKSSANLLGLNVGYKF